MTLLLYEKLGKVNFIIKFEKFGAKNMEIGNFDDHVD